MDTTTNRLGGCGCLFCATPEFSRRKMLGLGLGAALVAGLAPRMLFAAGGDYEAMLLTCIDPRFVQLHHDYMHGLGLKGKYSQFVIAGGPAAMVTDKFADWHKAFWDNLAASIQLHNIKKVVALSHRDCGAVKIAFGEAAVKDPDTETTSHQKMLRDFRALVAKNQPKLQVETGLIGLDGKVLLVS
jgi:carbonic anhydrase